MKYLKLWNYINRPSRRQREATGGHKRPREATGGTLEATGGPWRHRGKFLHTGPLKQSLFEGKCQKIKANAVEGILWYYPLGEEIEIYLEKRMQNMMEN